MKSDTEIRRERGGSVLPVGKAGMPSDVLYYERRYYKDVISPDFDGVPSQDFWYTKPFYGLINRKAETVYPTEAALKQLRAKDTLLAMNFVVDAFEDFKDFMKRAVTVGQIDSKDSLFSSIEPKRAWISVHKSYHTLMELHYDQFYTGWSSRKNRDLKINSFEQYGDQFTEYLLKVAKEFPFTRSGFITSSMNSAFTSGLVIDIADVNDNDDYLKVKYIADDNFEFYRNTAHKFGFMLDTNAPWRLVAKLGSTAMQRYMAKYEITFDNVFDLYYYRAKQTDLEVYKEYLRFFYESHVAAKPNIQYLSRSNSTGKLQMQSKTRKKTSRDYIFNLTYSYWFINYLKIKLKELNITLNNTVHNRLLNNMIVIEKKLGLNQAIEFLDKEINGFDSVIFPKDRQKRFS